MPPPSLPTGLSRMSKSNNGFIQLPQIFLLALVVATCIRLAVLSYLKRKSRISMPCSQVQEKVLTLCQVPSEKDLRQHRSPDSKDQYQNSHVSKHRQDCSQPQSEDQSPPDLIPLYPWTCPPQPLPGPYDPRLYPLPTIRRHSYANHTGESATDTETEINTISYTRRVSTNSVPTRQLTLHGTVSDSPKGWRRNQWVVTGG